MHQGQKIHITAKICEEKSLWGVQDDLLPVFDT
jgi:hypothetical protein